MQHLLRPLMLLAALGFVDNSFAASVPDLLHLKSISQVNFPLGQQPWPLAFSPTGKELLSIDNSGLSLWDVRGERLLWRFGLPAGRAWEYMPRRVDWQDNELILYAESEDKSSQFVTRLDAESGRVLGQEKRARSDLPRRIIAPNLPANQVIDAGFTLWQKGVSDPPSDQGLLATYVYEPRLKLLAFKRPDYDSQNRGALGIEPIQVFSEAAGKVVFRFQTIYFDSLSFLKLHEQRQQLSFSPDGKYLGWSAAGRLTVWDLHTGAKLLILRPQPFESSSNGLLVTWGADSRTVTLSTGNWLRQYALPDGQLLRSQDLSDGFQIFSIQWDVASGDVTALRVQTALGQSLRLGRSAGQVFFSATDRTFISFTDDQTAWLYRSGKVAPIELRLSRKMQVNNARINVATGTVDLFGTVQMPPDDTGQQRYDDAYVRISIANALKSESTGQLLTVKLQELARAEQIGEACTTLKAPAQTPEAQQGRLWPSPAYTLSLCEDQYLISAKKLGQDPKSAPLWQLSKLRDGGNPLISSDDRHLLLSLPNKEIRLYRAANASLMARLTFPDKQKDDYFGAFLVSPDERVLALQLENKWRFFDLRTKQELPAATALKEARQVAFVDGGKTLAVLRDAAVVFYQLK